MKAWLDELVDGIYRGLFALIVLFVPTLALSELAKAIVGPDSFWPSAFPAEYHGWSFLGLLCAYFLVLYRLRHRLPYWRDEEPTDS
ncbi:MAG: hypothetical protein VXZ92_01625 [SAR324 cluster bacterium]|nr:hypothetical protein [SAR324 cluster bacterium]